MKEEAVKVEYKVNVSGSKRFTFPSISGHEVILTIHHESYVAITGDCHFMSEISDLSMKVLGTYEESAEFVICFGSIAMLGIPEKVFLSPAFDEFPLFVEEHFKNSRFILNKKCVNYINHSHKN